MPLTKDVLAREVAEVLELPLTNWQGKAYEIVKAIFQVLTKALQSGQTIKVDGLGIFEVRERAPTRRKCAYFYGHKYIVPYRELKNLPAKRYVIFKPTKPLQRLLNEEFNVNKT